MIYCSDITKSYSNIPVLRGVSLKVEPKQLISIIGASGAGKSTLLHILGTLDKPDSGFVELAGQDVKSMTQKQISQFRNKMLGFIFQFHHLLPEFTALENVMLPGYIANTSEKELKNSASELLEYLGMFDRLSHKPGELSGGERQRVALARALINKPKILLADEPTGNLDQQNATEVLNLILKIRLDYGITTILVTHDSNIASKTDMILTMEDGKLLD